MPNASNILIRQKFPEQLGNPSRKYALGKNKEAIHIEVNYGQPLLI
jgi:hypothetical protein